jgi:hypothetical protein
MKTTITRYTFERAFADADRRENFSYEALGLLFEYFEELEDSTGEEIELDAIAICCEYYEDSAAIIASSYDIDISEIDPADPEYDEKAREIVREYLAEQTSIVGETALGFVYAIFLGVHHEHSTHRPLFYC